MRYLIPFFFVLLFLSCWQKENESLEALKLPQISGDKSWDEVSKTSNRVLYFLSPECPLCQNYAVAMRDLDKKYPEVEFIGIFPGKEYSEKEVKKYLIKFGLDMNCFFDPEFELTNMLEAEITPEAFLLNANGEVLYSGAIDNWAISLGQKRTVITDRYLENAIEASIDNREVTTKSSKAVGCFIQ